MSKIYIDCTMGISGDMLLFALRDLGAKGDVELEVSSIYDQKINSKDGHHHTAHSDIKKVIGDLSFSEKVKDTAKNIYKVIAKAEAKVHKSTEENVHFHEVGRKQAVANVVGVAKALDELDVQEIFCSEFHDGQGTIECSHGTIPVPVPAVKAMMENCDYKFVTEEDQSEMVTPSGLAMVMGIGGVYAESSSNLHKEFAKAKEEENLTVGIGKGSRNTGGSLKVYLIK